MHGKNQWGELNSLDTGGIQRNDICRNLWLARCPRDKHGVWRSIAKVDLLRVDACDSLHKPATSRHKGEFSGFHKMHVAQQHDKTADAATAALSAARHQANSELCVMLHGLCDEPGV